MATKCNFLHNKRRDELEHKIELAMASMVLYNGWCHGLKKGKLGSVDSVRVVVEYSKIILMRLL